MLKDRQKLNAALKQKHTYLMALSIRLHYGNENIRRYYTSTKIDSRIVWLLHRKEIYLIGKKSPSF